METRINNFALHNGKIVYVPDVPNRESFAGTDYYRMQSRYESALQSAIANGIEVSNQDQVQDAIIEQFNVPYDDGPFTLNCRVSMDIFKTKALVTFPEDKPEQKGAKRVEAYETSTQIVVMWTGAPDDNHSCDEMGCGSLDHVKYRFTKQQKP